MTVTEPKAHHKLDRFLLDKPFEIIRSQQELSVKYGANMKAFDPADWWMDTLEIDECSEIAVLLAHSAGIQVESDFGAICDWVMRSGFAKTILRDEQDYADEVYNKDNVMPDNYVYLCIAIIGQREANANHVWLVVNGKTAECHPEYGPISRTWDADDLPKTCYAVYTLF